jgi:hypothetical protein
MEPISLTIGVALHEAYDMVKHVAGHLAGDKAEDFRRVLKQRLAARLPLPRNHDLVREIRSAELIAARQVERTYRAWLDRLPMHEKEADQPFAEGLDVFLSRRLRPGGDIGIDFQILTDQRIDHVLDEMIDVAKIEGITAKGSNVSRKNIENAFLAEIESEIRIGVPFAFRDFFAPQSGSDKFGWYDMVALYVTEEIKTNRRFRSIFLSAELIDIKQLVIEADARSTALLAKGVKSVRQDIADIFTVIRDIKDDTATIQSGTDDIRRGQARILNDLTALPDALVGKLLAVDRRSEERTATNQRLAHSPVNQPDGRDPDYESTDHRQVRGRAGAVAGAVAGRHRLIGQASEESLIENMAFFTFWVSTSDGSHQLKRVGIVPSQYETIGEILDDIYVHYFRAHVDPYTYGTDWMIFGGPASLRLLAPIEWLLDQGRPVHMSARAWLASPPAMEAVDVGSDWWIKPLSKRNRNLEGPTRVRAFALCCHTQRLMEMFRNEPKAPTMLFGRGLLESKSLDADGIGKFGYKEIRNDLWGDIGEHNALVEPSWMNMEQVEEQFFWLFDERRR